MLSNSVRLWLELVALSFVREGVFVIVWGVRHKESVEMFKKVTLLILVKVN